MYVCMYVCMYVKKRAPRGLRGRPARIRPQQKLPSDTYGPAAACEAIRGAPKWHTYCVRGHRMQYVCHCFHRKCTRIMFFFAFIEKVLYSMHFMGSEGPPGSPRAF